MACVLICLLESSTKNFKPASHSLSTPITFHSLFPCSNRYKVYQQSAPKTNIQPRNGLPISTSNFYGGCTWSSAYLAWQAGGKTSLSPCHLRCFFSPLHLEFSCSLCLQNHKYTIRALQRDFSLYYSINVELNNLTEQQDSARYLVSLRMFLLASSLLWLCGVKYPLPFPIALPFFTRTQWKKIWTWFEDYLLILLICYILFYVQKHSLTIMKMPVRFGVFSLHLSASNCLLSFAYKTKSTYSSTTFNNANENYKQALLLELFYSRAQL